MIIEFIHILEEHDEPPSMGYGIGTIHREFFKGTENKFMRLQPTREKNYI